MNIEDIIKAFGQSYESVQVQKIVKELGIDKVPKSKGDDPSAYVHSKKEGIELSFEDEDYLTRKSVAKFGRAAMILVAVTLYTGKQRAAQFNRFSGSLPAGASFSDSSDELVAKLGPIISIDEEDGIVFNRLWKMQGYDIGFNYNESKILEYVQLIWQVYKERMES